MDKEIHVLDREKLKQAADRARLAEHVYSPSKPVPAGWRVVTTSAAFSNPKKGFFAILYEKIDAAPGETKHVVAFRGLSGIKDLSSLFSIFARRVPRQFGRALDYMQHLAETQHINVTDIEMTGHSLGGYLARTVGTALGVRKAWVFNSPGPTAETRRKLEAYVKTKLPDDHIIHVRSSNDIIAHWTYDDGMAIKLDTRTDHHSIRTVVESLQNMLVEKPAASGDVQKSVRKPLSLRAVFSNVSKYTVRARSVQKLIQRVFSCRAVPAKSRSREIRPIPCDA